MQETGQASHLLRHRTCCDDSIVAQRVQGTGQASHIEECKKEGRQRTSKKAFCSSFSFVAWARSDCSTANERARALSSFTKKSLMSFSFVFWSSSSSVSVKFSTRSCDAWSWYLHARDPVQQVHFGARVWQAQLCNRFISVREFGRCNRECDPVQQAVHRSDTVTDIGRVRVTLTAPERQCH